MIPLRDDNPSSSVPVVTRALIAINVLVFLYEVMAGPALRDVMFAYGLVPARITLAVRYGEEPIAAPIFTFLSSMFLHGGWMHLIGNMWYLWIFGDNVEDRLGHARFLVFYLLAGFAAAGLQYALNTSSQLPTVGASGAIAGVLGAYLIAFPHARVQTLIPFFPFFQVIALPAAIVLGLWFVYQFFSGFLSLGFGSNGGGVAWWAHVGGFGFGCLVMMMLGGARRSRVWVE